MKKILILLLAILLIALTGCGSDSSSGKSKKSSDGTKKESGVVSDILNGTDNNSWNADEIVKKISASSYTYSPKYSDSQYLVLVLENTSGNDCQLDISVDFFDSSKKIVGTKTSSIEAFASNTKEAVNFVCDEEFKTFEYELTVSKLDYYKCVTQDLTTETNTAKDKVIVSVTNSGDTAAEFVEATALFFKNGKLVYSNFAYIVDNDYEIKPGKTIKEEISCYDDFDSVEVYLDGRADDPDYDYFDD